MHGKISQTELNVAKTLKLTCMWEYQSKLLKCDKVSETDPYVAISVKLNNICPYLVKPNYIWENQSNRTKCSKISETDPYVAISFKLSHMCPNLSN